MSGDAIFRWGARAGGIDIIDSNTDLVCLYSPLSGISISSTFQLLTSSQSRKPDWLVIGIGDDVTMIKSSIIKMFSTAVLCFNCNLSNLSTRLAIRSILCWKFSKVVRQLSVI